MKTWISAITVALGIIAVLPSAAAAQAKKATVRITQPKDGAVLSGPVLIKLEATGVRIVPASVELPGTGHHHLFVDHPLNWISDTIPQGSPGIIHLGRGQTEFTLDSLAPGPHRVIALVADWRHVPLNPLVVDTVNFTIK